METRKVCVLTIKLHRNLTMENTKISWCDNTLNSWYGCSYVSPGCENCFGEALDKRYGGNHWQDPPRVMSDSNWKKPHKWNREAEQSGEKPLVFCGSMMDVFDKNAPEGQRDRLFDLIFDTSNLI